MKLWVKMFMAMSLVGLFFLVVGFGDIIEYGWCQVPIPGWTPGIPIGWSIIALAGVFLVFCLVLEQKATNR